MLLVFFLFAPRFCSVPQWDVEVACSGISVDPISIIWTTVRGSLRSRLEAGCCVAGLRANKQRFQNNGRRMV